MPASDLSKSIRRRILFNSLPSGTPQNVVQQAIDLLDSEFGEQTQVCYLQVVKRLREHIGHQCFGVGSGLFSRIVKLRDSNLESLGPDPRGGQADAVSEAASASGSRGIGHRLGGRDLVVASLVNGIFSYLKPYGEQAVTRLRCGIAGQVSSLDLSEVSRQHLAEWAKPNSSLFALKGTDQEIHQIVNAIFVWLCGDFGPVDAERALLNAVHQAEQLPEAFNHPPRKFL